MKKEEFWVFVMNWLASNTPSLVQLLWALVPVLALCLAGYALHIVTKKGPR